MQIKFIHIKQMEINTWYAIDLDLSSKNKIIHMCVYNYDNVFFSNVELKM